MTTSSRMRQQTASNASSTVDDVRTYVRDCRTVRRAIVHLLDDLDFVSKGGRLHYAADFSEMYAFALPEESAEEFTLFGDDERRAGVNQQLALGRLFHTGDDRVILLAPYAVELRTFIVNTSRRAFDDHAEKVAKTMRWITSPEAAEFQAILKIDGSSSQLTHDDEEVITRFLERHGDWFLSVFDDVPESPLARIHGLTNDGRMRDVTALGVPPALYDSEILGRWHERMARERERTFLPAASTRLDAAAMGIVAAANAQIASRRERLLLVTRSNLMHQVADEENDAALWGETGCPIRHPRLFALRLTIEGLPVEQQIEVLRQRLATVDEFLELIAGSDLMKADHGLAPSFREAFLRRIREDWMMSDNLAASLSGANAMPRVAPASHDAPRENAMRILALLRDKEDLRDLVFRRMHELASIVDQEHNILAGLLNVVDTSESPDRISSLIAGSQYRQRSVLRARFGGMPYALQFYSRSAEALANILHGEDANPRSWSELTNYFLQTCSTDDWTDRSEGLLAMGYIFGALDNWPLAEKFAASAIAMYENAESQQGAASPSHEAKYFLAVCQHRNQDRSPPRLLKGIELIDAATVTKRAARHVAGDVEWQGDPRYLTERALLAMILLLTSDSDILRAGHSLESVLADCQLAMTLGAQDAGLQERILNNRLYFLIQTAPLEYADLIRRDYDDLRSILERREPDWTQWPPYILHTIACVEWTGRAIGIEVPDELIVARLDLASADPDLLVPERETFKSHAKSIQRGEPIYYRRPGASKSH